MYAIALPAFLLTALASLPRIHLPGANRLEPPEPASTSSLHLKRKSVAFCFKSTMGKHTDSVDHNVLRRIIGKGKGWVFTPSDFQDLGSRTAIRLAIMRHRRQGTIRQLARGLYDYPDQHPGIGILSPSTDAIAQALKGRDAARLQPTGAYAANILGLSDQVPAWTVFLTDGRSRRVRIGKQEIIIRHTTLRNMATAGTTSGLVIQALRWIGRRHVGDQTCALLADRLTNDDKRKLIENARYAPAWVAEIMHRVAKIGKV